MDDKTIQKMQVIEDIGLFFEQMGLPRMAGRILGVLLISDPPVQSINDLCDTLKTSKSSVSIMARLLVEKGLVERVAGPISRRDYYRFKSGGWILYMRQWLALFSALHETTEHGLSLLDDKPPALKERLVEAHDLFSLMEEKLPALLEDLETKRQVESELQE